VYISQDSQGRLVWRGVVFDGGDWLFSAGFVSQLAHKRATSEVIDVCRVWNHLLMVWWPAEAIRSGLGGEAAVKLNGLPRVGNRNSLQFLMALCFTGLGNRYQRPL